MEKSVLLKDYREKTFPEIQEQFGFEVSLFKFVCLMVFKTPLSTIFQLYVNISHKHLFNPPTQIIL
jgi:hypothetical protein